MISDRELLIALEGRLRITADNCDMCADRGIAGSMDYNKGRAAMARAVAEEIAAHLATHPNETGGTR